MAAEDKAYEVVAVSKSNFKSVPLFIPSTSEYNPQTNAISMASHDGNPEDERETLVLCETGFKILQSVNEPISCVACAGPFRTGKSLMLSRFLNDSKVFPVGPTLEGCTHGIWISTSAILQKDDNGDPFYTFLLDCEGTGDPLEGDDASNARIALTCILISSMFVFNNTGRPDRGSLQFLNYLDTIRKRIPAQEGWNNRKFPSFLWVFRDFFLQLPTRQDGSGRQYTLKEYMIERVLQPTRSSATKRNTEDLNVVDSLLSDFSTFEVMGIGHPRRANELPFSAEEMSVLDDVEWSEFSDTFRAEIQQVIQVSLNACAPFQLGAGDAPAKGKQFAEWCKTVLTLVNSDDILPNIPDLQQQLLQSLADEAVDKAVKAYSSTMEAYLESCPVFNENGDGKTVADKDLKGVADEAELTAKSESTLEELSSQLKADSISTMMYDESLKRFKSRCVDSKVSAFSLVKEENYKRSKASCDVIARKLYGEFRARVRADATSMTKEAFEKWVAAMEAWFRKRARGPAVDETVETYFKDQQEADLVFLEKVRGINDKYKKTLKMKEKLDKDVKLKKEEINTLEESMKEKAKEHQEELDRLASQSKEEMEKLAAGHSKTLEEKIEEQRAKEAAKVAELTEAMNKELEKAEAKRAVEVQQKKAELENLKVEAEKRLADEIAAREERMKKEEVAHQEEVQRLLSVADEKMKKEIMSGEEKRKAEQFLLRKAMDKALADAEAKLADEVRKREERLRLEEEKHKEELEQVKRDMEDQKLAAIAALEFERAEEQRKHAAKVEQLEQECRINCTIL